MKKIFIVYAVIIVIVIIIALIKFGGSLALPFGKSATATIKNQKFTLMVAQSEKDKTRGLSGRQSLSANTGMIFIFDKPGVYSFWMKDMKFPIDMIFLNNNKIDTMYKNIPPPAADENTANLKVYSPKGNIDYVLELPAGTADKYSLKPGDTITLQNVPK